MELLEFLRDAIVIGIAGWSAVMSSIVVDENKKFRRKGMKEGTHDYYGNRIKDSNSKKV